MWRKRIKLPQSGQKIMKGLLVTPNQTEILDTHHHDPLDQTKIAEGPGLGHGLDHEGLELVLLTPGQKGQEETEDHALKGHTIMILTGDHTGVLPAEREEVLVLALTELGTALTPKMTIGRQGQGQVTQVDRPAIQAHIKSQNHLLTQNRRNPTNL